MSRIPFLRPALVTADAFLPYLREIEASRLYTNFGPLNARFEARVLADMFGGEGAVTTIANATLGLMLALRAAARPGGRYVVMPSFTFAATPLAAQWAGYEPYFVDIDADSWCLDEQRVRDALARLGDQVAAVMPYPAFATDLSLDFYRGLHEAGTPVIVDAAPCMGTHTAGRQHGAGFPGVVVYSLHATKAFGVGEGGIVHSANPDLVQRIRQLSNFGFGTERVPDGMGLNAKISEYTAAIALATLDAFPAKVAARRAVSVAYDAAIARAGLAARGWVPQRVRGEVATQIFSMLCPETVDSDAVIARLAAADIEARRYFRPACHALSEFAGCARDALPVTEAVSRRVVSLPFWEGMGAAEIDRVVAVLAAI